MKIGELGQATGTKVETIRYYEQIGLLAEPARNASNYRDYGKAHLARPPLDRQLAEIDRKIAELKAHRGELSRLIGDCRQGTVADCLIIDSLAPAGLPQ